MCESHGGRPASSTMPSPVTHWGCPFVGECQAALRVSAASLFARHGHAGSCALVVRLGRHGPMHSPFPLPFTSIIAHSGWGWVGVTNTAIDVCIHRLPNKLKIRNKQMAMALARFKFEHCHVAVPLVAYGMRYSSHQLSLCHRTYVLHACT